MFVILFVVLYFISPYLNLLFEHLSKKDLERCIVILLLLFSVYPTIFENTCTRFLHQVPVYGMGTVAAEGSIFGYTIVNFCVMYIIGGYLRKYPVNISAIKSLGLYILCGIAIFFMGYAELAYTSYANIFVILESVFLFLTFSNIKMKNNRIINSLSKSAFGVYLLHTCPLFLVHFWQKFDIPDKVSGNTTDMLVNVAGAVVIMYLLCMAIDYILRNICNMAVRVIKRFIIEKKTGE